MLGASLAVKIHHPPVRDLEDLITSKQRVIITNGTSVYRFVLI